VSIRTLNVLAVNPALSAGEIGGSADLLGTAARGLLPAETHFGTGEASRRHC
jgi:hypothetical protein